MNTRKHIALLLIVAMLFGLIPQPHYALEQQTSDMTMQQAQEAQFAFDEESGAITGFAEGYTHESDTLIIPSEIDGVAVKAIGNTAFARQREITNLVIEEGIERINQGAFQGTGIVSLTLPNSVKRLERMAFAANTSLSEVNLNEGLEYIGQQAFMANANLSGELIIPSTVNEIMTSAFNRTNISSLHLLGGEESARINLHSGLSSKLNTITVESPLKPIDFHFNTFEGTANLGTVKASASSEEELKTWLEENINISIGASYVNTQDGSGANDIYVDLLPEWDTEGFVQGEAFEAIGTMRVHEFLPLEGYSAPNVKPENSTVTVSLIIESDNAFTSEDFTYGYFEYKGSMQVAQQIFGITGFSDEGLAKATKNPVLVIPKTVTVDGEERIVRGIAPHAFKDQSLQSVTFPETIGEYDFIIGNAAFQNAGLEEVTLSEGVKNIFPFAFYGNNLTSVTLPSTIHQVHSEAFRNNQIESLYISDLVEGLQLDGWSFAGNKLTNIKAPFSIFKIQANVFNNNPQQVQIFTTNPAHLEASTYIVSESDGHKFILVTEGINRTALYQALVQASKLDTQDYAEDAVAQLNEAIANGRSVLGSYDATQEEVDEATEAIYDAIDQLQDSGVDQSALRAVIVKAESVRVGLYTEESYLLLQEALEHAKSVVNTPLTKEEVDAEVQALQSAIDSLELSEEAKYTQADFVYDGSTIVGFSEQGHRKFEVNKDLVLPEVSLDGVTIDTIGEGAFHTMEGVVFGTDVVESPLGLTSVVLPPTIKRIENEAFQTNNLAHIQFPEGLEYIGKSAFNGNQLEEVILPDSVVELGSGVFSLNQIKNVKLSNSLTTIVNGAFSRNINLAAIQLHEGLTEIGSSAFLGAPLTEIHFPSTLKVIKSRAFSSHRFAELTIPGNVEVIESYAFMHNKKFLTLKSLTLEEGIEEIHKGAFMDGLLLETKLPNSLKVLADDAFKGNVDTQKEEVVVKLYTENEDHLAWNTAASLEHQEIILVEAPEDPEDTEEPSDPEDTEKPTPKPDIPVTPPTDEHEPEYTTIAGDSRIETAIALSQAYQHAKTAVLVNGWTTPDALVASVYADLVDAPILLTHDDTLPEATANELNRLGVQDIVIIGGSESVKDSIVLSLMERGLSTKRIAGSNRFETSIEVAKVIKATNGVREFYLADGTNFPDALAVSNLALQNHTPIVLTQPNAIPENVLDLIGQTPVTIIGGTASISEEVANQIPNVKQRIAGENRYETSLLIAQKAYKGQNNLYIANGEVAIDALTTGALLKEKDALLLLVHPDRVVPEQKAWVDKKEFDNIHFVGGDETISPKLKDAWMK